jgi:uncharacterized protein (TIGR03000 family)
MFRQIFAWSNMTTLALLGALLVPEPAAAQQGLFRSGRSGVWGPPSTGSFYRGGYDGFEYGVPGYYYSTPSYDTVPSFSGRRGVIGYQPSYSPWIGQEYGFFGMNGMNGIGDVSTVNRAALINVSVPANAVITFEGKETSQMGAFRQFISPPLIPGQEFSYTIKVRWTEDGTEVTRSRHITVHAGDVVNLTFNSGTPSTSSVD